VCLADFVASAVYGCGLAVDWASVRTTSQANRAIVPSTVDEQRRIVGVSFIAAAAAVDVAEALRAYAGCFLLPGSSGVRLVPDADAAAVATYRHAYGEIAAIGALELRDLSQAPTAVEVIYTDTSATPWRDASATAQIDGAGTTKPWRLSQVRLPGIHRYGQALREATERLNKLWLNDITTTLQVFDVGIRHDKGDIITVDHPLGLSMTPMRVADVGMPSPGRWELALVRHSAAAYSDLVASAAAIQDAQRIVPAPESLGIKLNVSDFAGTVNYNEAYIHAVDASGNALDAPGVILVNGVATAVPNGSLFTNQGPVAGYIVWDSAGATFSKAGGAVYQPFAMARRYQGAWQYDDNSAGWATFTPAATHWIIGTLESGAADTGGAPGLIAASMWAAASTLNSLEAGADVAYAAAVAAQGAATTAAGNASSALSTLVTMRSNGYLDAAEKPALMRQWQALTGEISGIQNQANLYGLTYGASAIRQAYDNAYGALSAYLGSLSPAWDDTSTDTPITPAVDQAKWTDIYTTRQALLNAIAAEAGKRAQWVNTTGRPLAFRVGAMGNLASPRAGFTTGLRNAETGAQVGNPAMRSYVLVELNRDGAVIYTNSYDVYGVGSIAAPDGTYRTASTLAADLNYICDNRKGNLIVIYSHDEPQSHRMDSGLPAAMYRCGASRAVFGSAAFVLRAAYILVGIAGCGEGNGAEVYAGAVDSDTDAWCELAFDLLDGQLRVSGTTSGARTLVDYGYVGDLAATKNTIYRQPTAPAYDAGGLWYDTDDDNRQYVAMGGSWVSVRDLGIAQAIADAAAAQSTADGKITSFHQDTPPSGQGEAEGDLWYDTNDGNKQYRYTTGVWVVAAAGIASPMRGSANAQSTANSKVTTFYGGSTPTALAVGDLWSNSTAGSTRLSRWDGSSWVVLTVLGDGDVDTAKIAADAATEITQDSHSFGGSGTGSGPTVQRSFTVTPPVAAKVSFTATIGASSVLPDSGNYLYWAVSAGGGADVVLGNCSSTSGSRQMFSCVTSFAAAGGVSLVFKLISNRNSLNPAIGLYDSSMRTEVVKR
jgi:hypothetical protein